MSVYFALNVGSSINRGHRFPSLCAQSNTVKGEPVRALKIAEKFQPPRMALALPAFVKKGSEYSAERANRCLTSKSELPRSRPGFSGSKYPRLKAFKESVVKLELESSM